MRWRTPPLTHSPTSAADAGMSILILPDEVLRHVASFLDDLEQGPFAVACRGTRAIVQAHRHGVVLSLCSCRPSQREFLHAFGLTLAEVVPLYNAPRIKQARVYDLKLCLPLALKIRGGWKGVKAAHLKQAEAAARKRKREETAAAEQAVRRKRVAAALQKMRIGCDASEFQKQLSRYGYDCGLAEAVKLFMERGCNFEEVVIAMAKSAVLLQRHRELASLLGALDLHIQPARWSAEMRRYVRDGEGDARALLWCISA